MLLMRWASVTWAPAPLVPVVGRTPPASTRQCHTDGRRLRECEVAHMLFGRNVLAVTFPRGFERAPREAEET